MTLEHDLSLSNNAATNRRVASSLVVARRRLTGLQRSALDDDAFEVIKVSTSTSPTTTADAATGRRSPALGASLPSTTSLARAGASASMRRQRASADDGGAASTNSLQALAASGVNPLETTSGGGASTFSYATATTLSYSTASTTSTSTSAVPTSTVAAVAPIASGATAPSSSLTTSSLSLTTSAVATTLAAEKQRDTTASMMRGASARASAVAAAASDGRCAGDLYLSAHFLAFSTSDKQLTLCVPLTRVAKCVACRWATARRRSLRDDRVTRLPVPAGVLWRLSVRGSDDVVFALKNESDYDAVVAAWTGALRPAPPSTSLTSARSFRQRVARSSPRRSPR